MKSSAVVMIYSNGILYLFQAEDSIRDGTVAGVQTCALPISSKIVLIFKKFIYNLLSGNVNESCAGISDSFCKFDIDKLFSHIFFKFLEKLFTGIIISNVSGIQIAITTYFSQAPCDIF